MKHGDLVHYSLKPTRGLPPVIPKGKEPVGVIISVRTITVGNDEETQALIEIANVRWSNPLWNGEKGYSEEFKQDLKIIQEA